MSANKMGPEEPGGVDGDALKTQKEVLGKQEAAIKPVPFLKMFSLASTSELALLGVGVLGCIVNGGSQPMFVYVWGRMIDSVGGGPSMMEQVSAMCYVAAITWVAAAMQSVAMRLFAQAQSNRMREMYYESLINQDISWYDLRTAAAMAAELDDDAQKVAAAFGDKFAAGLQGFFCFLIAMGVGFALGWKLSLVILGAVPLMTIGMVIMGQAVQEVLGETQSWYAKAAATVEESLFALRTVVAFGGEHREIESYSRSVRAARKGAVKNYYRTSFGMGYVEFVWAGANAAALYFGMTLIYDGEVNDTTGRPWSGGDILTVFFSILIGGFSIGQVEPATKVMNEGRISAARFFAVYESAGEIQCKGMDTRKSIEKFESFELRQVHFSYPARPTVPVLKGLSLKISKGERVAVVGESGSGKSTVMSLLERFYDPTDGSVLVNGEEFRGFSPTSVRALIGYVGQEPVLFATTVRNNIMQGWPTATKEDLQWATDLAQLSFIEALPERLDTFVGSGGSQFSGGQKQRIAIARAMLRKPQVLFLDEATSALDNASERMIQETIEKIGTQGVHGDSLTTVAIAHRLSTVRNCDVIFALKDGVVVESGNHQKLMEAKGLYYGLAASQEANGLEDPTNSKVEDVDANEAADVNAGSQPATAALNSKSTGSCNLTNSESAKPRMSSAMEEQHAEEKRHKEVAKSYSLPVRRLLSYNRPEWVLFVPGILGGVLHGASNPIQAYLLVNVLDAFYSPKEEMKDEVFELSMMFLILGAAIFIGAFVHTLCFGMLSEAMTMRLRIHILQQIFRQEIGFHDDPTHTPGIIGTALQTWAYRVRAMCAGIEANANVMGSLSLGILLSFYGCWQMALLMLAAVPVLVGASSIQMVFVLGGSSGSNEKMQISQQVVSDSVQNARTVQACGMEKALVTYHRSLVSEASTGFVARCLGAGAAFGLALATPMFVMAVGFWYSEQLVRDGAADFKGVMLAIMGMLFAAMGAGQATASLGDTAKAKVACHDMFKLIDRESLVDGLSPTGTKPSWASAKGSTPEAGQIEFQGVRFFYPFRQEVQVLRGVNFKIEAGQSVGLVGPSGGGKSTIMALLQRFYDPSEGSVFVGVQRTDLKTLDIRWWRRQVGFVGQEPVLFNTSVRSNVMYGLDAEAGETITEERLAQCKKMAHLDFIDDDSKQGWDTEVGARGSRLSGGQKQRVAICRALVRNPPVLLLDEATSALDTESERVVQEALEEARQGRTSFAIAHRLSTVQDCDVILVTAEGTIVEQGSHSELMDLKGVYFKLQASSR